MAIFSKKEKKLNNRTTFWGHLPFFGTSAAGQLVTEQSAMQQTAVFACVRILSETLGSLPLNFYEYKDDGSKKKLYESSLYRLLHDEPNPEMTSLVFRETLMSHLALYGNAYAQIVRNGYGNVLALYPLMPDRMEVDRDENGNLFYRYRRYKDESREIRDGETILLPYEILHIPGLGYDGLKGYSPIAMCRNAIGISIACEQFGSKFFSNGATPGAVLEHPAVVKNPDRLKKNWYSTYGGANNYGKVAILEEGMKYTPIAIPPNDAQFLETRKFQVNEIARIYRVPPHMLADLEKSSFSNIEQMSLEFVKYTLDPWVVRWEQSLNKALIPEKDKGKHFFKFNLEGLLRGDYVSRMNGYAIARQNGWMSANDIRDLEDLNKISDEDGGNLYLVNGNMLPLSEAGAAYNKADE